ncbi:myb-like protein X [Pseudorasbora parva]|uniref:myb-like protein X n=1 Tax=Pseudorasbora parva TaxID=51549 RepID=UPI00351E6A59
MIMKDKHLVSPCQLSSSSKIRSMTFDISEVEQNQSPLINDTIPGSTEIEKEVAFKENEATQTSLTSAAEVSRDEEKNNCVVNLESEDLVNDNKSEQEEANKKEESVEKDQDEPDEAQGGQDIVAIDAEHAQEELKTNGETKKIKSRLTHQEKALEEDQLEDKTTDNEKTTAEGMLDNSRTHTEPETSKGQLEDDQQDIDKEQEPEEQHIEITESMKSEGDPIHLKTSAGSKEVEEEEAVLSSSITFDAEQVPKEPSIVETKSFIPVEDVDHLLSEDVQGSPTKELNTDENKLDVLDILRPVESDFTVFHDKEQTMKSKVKARKVLDT